MTKAASWRVDGSIENIAGAKFCPAELLTRRPSSVNRFS